MLTVTIDEIQENLTSYLHQVAAGQSIIITQAGKPIAEIKPVSPIIQQMRPYGLCAGDFIVPDDFDSPLPEDILNSFEGK
ncbi:MULTISPECIES: type II toxin-antitoxin system prevent-host-death family antitoxin [unclassified Nodularia (in: cyanobacteria)]|uniref:type II toxin-antitoxin system Phd/YefM family antitoxin n=1 Tax=unclassified Nodularia (in: cyanobacteria) TaxID=2656917 RepID=UPI001881B0D6|nr:MULTISPECIES: type II toxin-antitoxin system prevent-host-death family antitoxin [unclassified Nodularia (in: cyanobacteria)]MBE9198662.1 type II toxin-antitoxin system Phd/YefM family antitoxin [Nodularia sp. LEGE 06071]MCC2691768.1 type II toxin-antitoxin system Phd/YefM family antitoxin [Nodularia sp. LEGE 04288]